MNEYLLETAIKNAVKESFSDLSADIQIEACAGNPGQILRMAISSELSAINLYVSLADMTDDPLIKKVLLDIVKEEKTHVAEFETLLNEIDPEQQQENKAGQKEVEAMK